MWKISIDTGGTFTDALAESPTGHKKQLKVLSSARLRGFLKGRLPDGSFQVAHKWPVRRPIFEGYTLYQDGQPVAKVQHLDPQQNTVQFDRDPPIQSGLFEIGAGEEAPVLAARLLTEVGLYEALPPIHMRLGTTRGTNALLEQTGANCALLITRGFADLPYIGTQQRPHLFQLAIPEPLQLYGAVIEVDERLTADGTVLHPLDTRGILEQVQASGAETVAIALLHSYRNADHEQVLAALLQKHGYAYISCSAALSQAIKLYPRCQTALVNAYLQPILQQYLQRITGALDHPDSRLQVMSSAGGLIDAAAFQPKDSLLSGPAGGVVGAGSIGQRLQRRRLLTLDMGGTSTDTSRYEEGYDYQFETQIADIQLQVPALRIETVAAGGGSICYFDGERLRVGPDSAGAVPGPACYGAGGPLTITDLNLLAGRIDPRRIGIPLDYAAAQRALEQLQGQVQEQRGEQVSKPELIYGFLQIANEKMADAIRRISIKKGFDTQQYTLLAFGGAGGMHACAVASLLDIKEVILPYQAGVLSAFGISQARVERLREKQIQQLLQNCEPDLKHYCADLEYQARRALQTEGFPAERAVVRRRILLMRFQGQEYTLDLEYHPEQPVAQQFLQQYEALFGYHPKALPIEVVSLKVIVTSPQVATPEYSFRQGGSATPVGNLQSEYVQHSYPVFDWETLPLGASLRGPALLLGDHATAFVPAGWDLHVQEEKNLIAQHRPDNRQQRRTTHRESIDLELFTNRFMAIAEEMGAQLQRTAFSVNVKERLDFSCAILDPRAHLLVNAPHIPVHLGSLGICARLMLQHQSLGPGDVLLTNHPRYGGSHLPDITLLAGAYDDEGRLIGYLINRAHHAEIGGKRPGSMPPDAKSLAEEGVSFVPTYLLRKGQVRWEAIRTRLQTATYPSRSVTENLADLNAALSSLQLGIRSLQELAKQQGLQRVHHFMERIQDNAEHILQRALLSYTGQRFSAREQLDDGHALEFALHFDAKGLDINFSGSGSRHPGNLNANLSIVHSVIVYVLRLLCQQDTPLNEGLMRSVRIHLPEDSLLHPNFVDDPTRCPAVVGGNTEVSQRLTDTLLKALGLAACSQGTMNNFLFGNDSFGYYETIGGGSGATAGHHGRSGVHQHMTNTRMTDPEEMELNYPVRLWRFGLRRNSGGAGQWRGGDGIVRELEFLKPVALTLLSQHRKVSPYGLNGGEDGQVGRQYVCSTGEQYQSFAGIAQLECGAGQRIRLETPGGGGYGKTEEDEG